MSEVAPSRAQQAIAAVKEILSHQRLDASDLEVLRDENNVVLMVSADTVAKAVEFNKDGALRKEASILGQLHDCPAVRPARQGIGPFVAQGWTVIFLERLMPVAEAASSEEMQQSLAVLHKAMETLDLEAVSWLRQLEATVAAWQKHPLGGEVQQVMEKAHAAYVSQVFRYAGPTQLIHGDCWSGQVIKTADGLRWIDFENVAVGPKEWDLACFDVVDSYGDHDPELQRLLRLVRSWTVAVWSHVNSEHSPQLAWHVEHHVGVLRDALEARTESILSITTSADR